MNNEPFELVITVADHGAAAEVMDAAKAAGARGGTVARARGMGLEEVEKFLHITIQPEKEMVLILVPSSIRPAVMKAVCGTLLTSTGRRGIAFSLPVSAVAGLTPEESR